MSGDQSCWMRYHRAGSEWAGQLFVGQGSFRFDPLLRVLAERCGQQLTSQQRQGLLKVHKVYLYSDCGCEYHQYLCDQWPEGKPCHCARVLLLSQPLPPPPPCIPGAPALRVGSRSDCTCSSKNRQPSSQPASRTF